MKIAIANRGEVAVRIHHAIEELGYTSVLLHSTPDIKTQAYKLCNETIEIGPGPAHESYLNADHIIEKALESGADLLHPGFGFLSENSEFAAKVIKAGIKWIGPTPESINLFGDKIKAKEMALKADVPTIPGYQGADQSFNKIKEEAEKIGFPVIVKASSGGGGRGLRVVYKPEGLESALSSAKKEGLNSFGNDTVFLEKYFDQAKHIEVQVFGNCKQEYFILGERECSIQRKLQKIIEEAPSASLSKEKRLEVFSYAYKLAKTAQYTNAGTVEFLYQDENFYFLEMNTRLQVEHPVTEEVHGVDLVKSQILTALNEVINFEPMEYYADPKTHSIECRLYAEDSFNNGMPSPGEILDFQVSDRSGVRYEIGFKKNDIISTFYDSMFAKIICTAPTRDQAIAKTKKALEETFFMGIKSNKPLLFNILDHDAFITSTMDTQFIKKYYPEGLKEKSFTEDDLEQIKQLALKSLTHKGKSNDTTINPFNYNWGN